MLKQITSARKRPEFNPLAFLSTIGDGREMLSFQKKEIVFTQGDSTDGLFFIQKGKVRLSVVTEGGKEATLAILGERDFFGESVAWPASFDACRQQRPLPTASFYMSERRP